MRPSALFRPARVFAQQVRHATSLRMPAMSPTMTEGGITGWKKAEGESFAAGDVLLEVETDKATIDVEAQDDGIMGKIITQAGSSKIPVGQIIAVLAEEGEDLASLEIPKDLSPPGASESAPEAPKAKEEKKAEEPKQEKKAEAKPESASAPAGGSHHGHKEIKHSKPIFPSVSRLLIESDLTSEQISKLKGTGRNGMLTKGDVLVAIGQLQNPYGSAEKLNTDLMGPSGKRVSERAAAPADGKAPAKKEAPLDGPGLRRAILSGMARATAPAKPIIEHAALPLATDPFDEILASYSSLIPPAQPKINITIPPAGGAAPKDEWAGLF